MTLACRRINKEAARPGSLSGAHPYHGSPGEVFTVRPMEVAPGTRTVLAWGPDGSRLETISEVPAPSPLGTCLPREPESAGLLELDMIESRVACGPRHRCMIAEGNTPVVYPWSTHPFSFRP